MKRRQLTLKGTRKRFNSGIRVSHTKYMRGGIRL